MLGYSSFIVERFHLFFSQEKDVAREKIGLSELAITNAVGSPHTDTYFRQIRTRILNNLSHEEIFGVSYVNFKSALELNRSVRRYYKVRQPLHLGNLLCCQLLVH